MSRQFCPSQSLQDGRTEGFNFCLPCHFLLLGSLSRKGKSVWVCGAFPQIYVFMDAAKIRKNKKKTNKKNSIKDKIDLLHVSPVKGINFQKQPASPPLALEVTSFLHKTFITLPLKMISEDDPDMKIRNQPESISLPVWCQLPPLRLFIYPGSGLSLCL